jgi:hypothetical protein
MVDDDWPAAKIALVARLGTASTAATVDPG